MEHSLLLMTIFEAFRYRMNLLFEKKNQARSNSNLINALCISILVCKGSSLVGSYFVNYIVIRNSGLFLYFGLT